MMIYNCNVMNRKRRQQILFSLNVKSIKVDGYGILHAAGKHFVNKVQIRHHVVL